ncbi:hypothetical protein PPL_05343 [Heterostelium album PN500]|uniref:RING-type domain-containing protein n=1 Tax=Heterostelium pallidum (strain ATCC 26659 / Pp 5 / PN500) TaxID=670386 RepID=D3B9X3_HETP5|nr:hypothetical protein PPL_05343 [Heterostelium album PN500]EFA81360.1 hypothetical protein PPL_05343 [Heterostelium album PN500]|eukprot:XP_020433478.1 hypothetical protein PPL_05343 [Heterostelium album PN500]
MADPIDSTLFLIPPDDKFLCCNHGGLMSCPIVNIECGHLFCPTCIETLVQCPIDHMVINTLDINFQLKNELDHLLCYCKYGVEEVDGMLTVRHDGCGSIISYGSKPTHEESCRYNPANLIFSTSSSDSEFDRINSPRTSSAFASFDSSSTESSPFTKSTSSSTSSSSSLTNQSFSVIKKNDSFDINSGSDMINSSSCNSISSINSNVVVGNTSKSITPNLESNNNNNNNQFKQQKQQQQQYHDAYDNEEKNEMWESSTNLFYSSSRFCPNKDNGCYYYGKCEDTIKYHLENECQAQRMKNRINQLESIIEKKDTEINTLKTSIGIDESPSAGGKKTKTIITRSSIGDILVFIFSSIKKRVSKGIQRIKRFFSPKNYKKL